ncbi:wall-associated receptor kinase-like 2 isoform X2 [Beta vulgaris subsp. vulgaris]|uniref:wall-associated receptor kinase-like 2 isoform X2 n=1 Tax=Beta vulgaris subsp. vulgaris TaxID=3555 RepID=UPI0025497E44|nr:wall-associated receptor kinase-like 2 isoform X2 [Beta vulgaris subsp. vulgaris]
MTILNPFTFLVSILFSSCLWKLSEQRNETECIYQCGKIAIPYPFGIGPDHYSFEPNFAVSCNSSSPASPIPFLKKFNLEILNIDFVVKFKDSNDDGGYVTVKIPSIVACGSTKEMWTSPNLNNSPFRYFARGNSMVSVGCYGHAMLYNETGGILGGCTSVCSINPPSAVVRENKCSGYRCCYVPFPESAVIKQYGISAISTNSSSGNCRSAFLTAHPRYETGAPSMPGISAAVPVVIEWGYHSLTFILGTPLVIFGACCVWWQCKTKKRRKEVKLRAKYFKEQLEVQGFSNEDVAHNTKLFTLSELKRSTDNFNNDLVLGKGGQGTVYKGMLKHGQVVAVKKSRALDESQWSQFINEVLLLSQIKHRHVVKTLGCCVEDDNPLVVYEFVCNGTLSEHIKNSLDELLFTWEMRLRIAFEAAMAIAYLHSEFSTPIYHRDIKTSNILLDDKFRAKLSDFGISREVSIEQTHLTTDVQGTFGYLDPEYFYLGQYSEKSDVYSFGVVLVELLTGQKPIRTLITVDEETEIIEDEKDRTLVTYFISSMNDSTLLNIVDPIILEGGREEEIMEFANLAKQCLHPTGLERPTMKEVTTVLQGLRCQSSSCVTLTPNDQVDDWETESSVMTEAESSNAYLRSVTCDVDSNFYRAEVEMRLLHTS